MQIFSALNTTVLHGLLLVDSVYVGQLYGGLTVKLLDFDVSAPKAPYCSRSTVSACLLAVCISCLEDCLLFHLPFCSLSARFFPGVFSALFNVTRGLDD